MEFRKYSSIENSYREKYLESVRETLKYFGCEDAKFSVSEKVDGCNVSVITDGENIITGKRSSILEPDEKFYGFQEYAEKMLKEKITGIFKYFSVYNHTPVHNVQVFGEFFGGGYKDYKTNESRIQKGIDYCPEHCFYAFDILVTDTAGKTEWIGVDECNAIFEKFGLFYNKELFRGTLDECLAYSPVFISTIGTRLGYPEIEDNFAEGVVIKPVEPLFMANGERIIIKNKNPKFEEFEKKDKKPKEAPVYSDTCNKCIEEVGNYCTESRLNNVISHLGEIEMPKQTGLVLKEYSIDTIDEFRRDHPEYDSLDSSEQKVINKIINKFAVDIIKRKF